MTRMRASFSTSSPLSGPGVTRRRFNALAGGTLASFAIGAACAGSQQEGSDGRITARPRSKVGTSGSGERALGLGISRDGLIHLPSKATGPLPLLVLLHGAGGSASGITRRLGAYADEQGVALLVPDSRGSTWDAIGGALG